MKNKIAVLGLIVYLALIISCAQTGQLTGGSKDIKAPQMIGSNPVNKATNFKGKKITIAFDEFFELSDIQEEFVSSPPLEKMPEFTVRGKKLIIKFDEELQDSVTYSFQFGEAIQDFHERNPASGFRFVFATGNSLDTMAISGRVADSFTLLPVLRSSVMIYSSFEDSIPFISKPDYVAKTDSSGHFELDYIKPGKYKLFALKDANSDLLFNMPEEQIAFIDSFIVPIANAETKIDTVLAGTEMRHPETNAVIDTLLADTVIKSRIIHYLPNNIKLFSYEEDRLPQFVVEFKRPERAVCKFIFNKPQEKFNWECLNDAVSKESFVEDVSPDADTAFLWIQDELVRNIDTLKFKIPYVNKDSIGNSVTDIDTLIFVFSDPILQDNGGFGKKNEKEVDSNEDSLKIVYTEIKQGKQGLEIGADFSIKAKYPITKLDTSKMRLFQVIDTLVADPLTQRLMVSQRTDVDKFLFVFKRALVNEFRLQPINFTSNDKWYSTEYSLNRDTISCTITKDEIKKRDSLRILVHYDNDFYLDEIQKFKDTLWLPTRTQTINDIQRKSQDTIMISFGKPAGTNYSIGTEEQGFNSADFEILSPEYSSISKVLIKNKKLVDKDSLNLIFKVYDRLDSLNNKVFYTDTTLSVYKRRNTQVVKSRRISKNEFYVVFNKPLVADVELLPTNFSALGGGWFTQQREPNNDTLKIKINNKQVSKQDTLKLEVAYSFINKNKKDTTIKHQLALPVKAKKKKKKIRVKETEKLIKVEVNSPISMNFIEDSVRIRQFFLSTDWKPSMKYRFEADSMAFVDIFGNYSIELGKKIIVKDEEDYGKININISQLGSIESNDFYKNNQDTTSSISQQTLSVGQVIVQLTNDKDEAVREQIINSDGKISFLHIPSGNYFLRMYYDSNSNRKYDIGDYLKHIQPERSLYYRDEIEVKAKWEAELEWEINYQERKLPVKKEKKKKKRR